jgi:hypothetical protein
MATSLEFHCIVPVTWEQDECCLLHLPSKIGTYARLWEDSRFRNIHGAHGYLDHYAVLSPAEAAELISLYYEKAVCLEKEGELENIQTTIKRARIVVAHYYEWESGLG